MSEAEEKKEKKKSPWVVAATVLGAIGTVITAVAALLSAMDVEQVVNKNEDKNELMLKSLFNYSTENIGDIKTTLGRIEGELDVLREVCMSQSRPECESDGDCQRGKVCQDGKCVRFGHRRPRPEPKPPTASPRAYNMDTAVDGDGVMESIPEEMVLKEKPKKRDDFFSAIQQKAQMGEAWDGDWKSLEEAPPTPAGE